MKIKMNLKTKMLLYILTASSIIYALALGYVSLKLDKIAYDNAKELTDTYAKEYANYTKADISVDMNVVRSMGQISQGYKNFPQDQMIDMFNTMLENTLAGNPNFLATFYNWELNAIWPDWKKPYGRMRLTYYKANNQIYNNNEIIDTVVGFTKGAYYQQLASQAEDLMDPYYFAYDQEIGDILMTTASVPIIVDGISLGVVGVDVGLQRFQDIIKDIHPIEGSYSFLIANNGQFVAHAEEEFIGKFIEESTDDKSELLQKIQNGEEFEFEREGFDGKEYWIKYVPIFVGECPKPWSFGFAIPVDIVMAESKATLKKSIYVGFGGLLIAGLIIWLIAHSISRPIIKTTKILGNLAKGDIDKKKKIITKSNDEIGEMSESVNTLIDGLNKTAEFAKEIGKGDLETEFELLSDKDVLGNSLIEMRESLKSANEQEAERRLKDQKQNWVTEGLAKFGEILRQNTDDMQEFSYHIISNLAKYIDANQGGIYMINDEEKNDVFVELLAFFAYERSKYEVKRIEIGDGLVGRCAQERKTVYITELPEDYIKITSGLGRSIPNALLVVPLTINDEIFGVVELAGFNTFEDHVIKFIEEVGESIASTIATTKINIRTTQLLEQSQQQSEEMAAQEEEMRQNMEELQATQEEAGRRSSEMEGLLNALNSANLVIEYDLEGIIIEVNENYLKLLGVSRDKMIGTHHSDNMQLTAAQKKDNKKFWVDLKNGISKKETEQVTMGGKTHVFVATYTPILDENGNPIKILKISTDISEL